LEVAEGGPADFVEDAVYRGRPGSGLRRRIGGRCSPLRYLWRTRATRRPMVAEMRALRRVRGPGPVAVRAGSILPQGTPLEVMGLVGEGWQTRTWPANSTKSSASRHHRPPRRRVRHKYRNGGAIDLHSRRRPLPGRPSITALQRSPLVPSATSQPTTSSPRPRPHPRLAEGRSSKVLFYFKKTRNQFMINTLEEPSINLNLATHHLLGHPVRPDSLLNRTSQTVPSSTAATKFPTSGACTSPPSVAILPNLPTRRNPQPRST